MDSSSESISALISAALDETYRAAGWADTTDRLNEFRRERACDLNWLSRGMRVIRSSAASWSFRNSHRSWSGWSATPPA